MGLKVKKRERETPQALIRRFTKSIQQSGLLLRARKIRYKKREKSQEMRKRAALRREETKKQYEKLRKLGISRR